MSTIKAFYEIQEIDKDSIIKTLDETFGLKGTTVEDYISMRGGEESGIETVRLSIEGNIVKVMVVLEDDDLLDRFTAILGEPKKVKGRRRNP